MNIRYRDKSGRFISAKRASGRKQVTSQLYDGNKKIGKTVQGYYRDPKKLERYALPSLKLKKETTRYVSRRKPLPTTYYESPDFDDDPDTDTLEELEDLWQDEYEDDFPELDEMDIIDEMVDDEGEWYHE